MVTSSTPPPLKHTLLRLLWFFMLLYTLLYAAYATAQHSQRTVLTHTHIVNVADGSLLEDQTLILEAGKIAAIVANPDQAALEGATVIDLEHRFVIPGLIDAHVHLFRPQNRIEILKQLLQSGVTSVRDMGGDARLYQKLNQLMMKDSIQGPTIYYSANLFGPAFLTDPRTKFAARGFEPGQAPWMHVIEEDTDIAEVVASAKAAGVTGLKLYDHLRPEQIRTIAAEAHKLGLRVWSHSSVYPSRPSEAVHNGVDVLSHSLGLIFEVQPDMPPNFLTAISQVVPTLDFKNIQADQSEFDALFESMKAQKVIFEPTLMGWSADLRKRPPTPAPPAGKNPTAALARAGQRIDREAVSDWNKRITRKAHQQGVAIAAGTDMNQTLQYVQDELALLVGAGMSPAEALRSATLINAMAIGIEATHGSIEVGKQADLVILNTNPLEDIQQLKNVNRVFKNGVLVQEN
ncbi:amidohydrolase family protein [Croceiramulus getboli]|nr:amidohydrolase family protein [Flavobacteriaceae bacterium YJPT1-3]